MKLTPSLLAVFSAVGLMVACKPAPESISVTPDNVQLTEKTASATLSAEALDKNGARVEGVAITWSSADAAVASIDAAGVVSAVGSGSTTVTAKTDKLSKDVAVTVSLASAVKVDKETLELKPEMTSDTVTASVVDEKGNAWTGQAALTWTSADPNIATVDNGKVTGVNSGSTTITVSFNEMKKEIPVTSTVVAAPVDPAAAGAAPAAGAPADAAAGAAAPAAAPATK